MVLDGTGITLEAAHIDVAMPKSGVENISVKACSLVGEIVRECKVDVAGKTNRIFLKSGFRKILWQLSEMLDSFSVPLQCLPRGSVTFFALISIMNKGKFKFFTF